MTMADALAALIAAAQVRLTTPGPDEACGLQGCGRTDCRCIRDENATAALSAALEPFTATPAPRMFSDLIVSQVVDALLSERLDCHAVAAIGRVLDEARAGPGEQRF